ncbi:conserved hypothetical protein, PP_1857 family [Formivibrio citricus]|uniref:Protein-arginine rhamnosyltransferase n=1 Tax=Formivibrio citricus TaxID=83765 RepID=A0A1I4YKL3_9NEIS|nr:elongation factor P maturation arginine rhamnosyltransferase EarP [Formivibrio citricus]SFN38544.1 conserved hypothetical protein, PP_1857 family [Formivibrio citricus]
MSIGRWDIFCTVVDNFGDIGVCWRLARQLAQEHGLLVRLWVDDLASFARIQPEIDPALDEQPCQGVIVCRWSDPFPQAEPADVVVEAFACELPPGYVARMRAAKPVWINLEYLSAEDWVEGCHGLVSPQAGLAKYFFFPGFSGRTGGVPGEAVMRAARAQWSPADGAAFLSRFAPVNEGALAISLFAYENPALAGLLRGWSAAGRPVHAFLPEGRLLPQVRQALAAPGLNPGETVRSGALTLTCLPMLPQDDYDRLLWSCDLNFVRGEDSFVRAQWAARPFVWHIYPQDDEAHHHKLTAYMDRYVAGMDTEAAVSLRNFWLAWNVGESADKAWPSFEVALPLLQAHAQAWVVRLTANGDLAANLVKFVSGKVQ